MIKNFFIFVIVFCATMLTCLCVVLYMYNDIKGLQEKTLGTYTNLHEYQLSIPQGIDTVGSIGNEFLNLAIVFFDDDSIIHVELLDKKMKRDAYITVPEENRTYIEVDSTYE